MRSASTPTTRAAPPRSGWSGCCGSCRRWSRRRSARSSANRYPRERIVVAINIARSVTIAAAAAAAFLSAPPGVIYALASVMGLLQSTFRPTQSALLPSLVRRPEELDRGEPRAHHHRERRHLRWPAIGGILLTVAGTDTIFAIAAASFLASALLLVGISVERSPDAQIRKKSFVSEAFAGFGTVARDARLRLIISLYGMQTLLAGSVNVLIVVLALQTLDLGKSGIGFLNSAIGVGGLLGGVVAVGLIARPRLASAFGAGLALAGLPIAAIGLAPRTATAVVSRTRRARNDDRRRCRRHLAPTEHAGRVLTRVMGVVQSVFVGTLGLGALLAPALIHLVGDRWTLAIVGIPIAVAAAIAWPRFRRIDAETARAPAFVDLLRSIPIFAPLPEAVLEQLARDGRTIKMLGRRPHHLGGRARRRLLRDRAGRGGGQGKRQAVASPARRRLLRRDRSAARRPADGDRRRNLGRRAARSCT